MRSPDTRDRSNRRKESKLPGMTYPQTRAYRRIAAMETELLSDFHLLIPSMVAARQTEIEEELDRWFPGTRQAIEEKHEMRRLVEKYSTGAIIKDRTLSEYSQSS